MVQCATNGVRLVAVGGKCVAHVGSDVHHVLVANGYHGRPVPVENTFDLLVRGEFVVVS